MTNTEKITISTLDSIAYEIILKKKNKKTSIVKESHWNRALYSAKKELYHTPPASYILTNEALFSDQFIVDEIEWVIEGQGLWNKADYLSASRIGREKSLTKENKAAIWEVYKYIDTYFRKNSLLTWNRIRLQAINCLRDDDKFDYVIVDEAQDLTTMALRLCSKLCRNQENLFLVADKSQSIHNKDFDWNKLNKELGIKRSIRTIRTYYRTTRQIAEAASQFSFGKEDTVNNKYNLSYVNNGYLPEVFIAHTNYDQCDWIAERIKYAKKTMREDWKAVAILVAQDWLKEIACQKMELCGVPTINIEEGNTHITENAVKVMTIHSAKGLEFPIVALPFLENDILPRKLDIESGDYEVSKNEQRRLFYVGATRAMWFLFVSADKDRASPFLKELDGKYWKFVTK